MTSTAGKNDNWRACPKCGEPVMIDPNTGRTEPCANCASLASKQGGVMGMGLILLGVAVVVAVIYFGIQLLLAK